MHRTAFANLEKLLLQKSKSEEEPAEQLFGGRQLCQLAATPDWHGRGTSLELTKRHYVWFAETWPRKQS